MFERVCFKNIIIILFMAMFLIPFQTSFADYNSFTVNIPNSQGGYTSLEIKQSGNGYTGPNGEYYSQFPTVSQLQAVYGTSAFNPVVMAPTISDAVQRERMIRQQADEQVEADRQKAIQQQQLLNQQMQQSIQEMNQRIKNQQARQLANEQAGEVQQQQAQPKQTPVGLFLSELMGWISTIFCFSIIGICGYTCYHASKGRMLFFYNWYDVLGSFAMLILSLALSGSDNLLMVYVGKLGIIGYNMYMAYTYYYPKKQYMNLIFVGLSRIIMSTLLPIAYILGLFLGPKRGGTFFEQITNAALQVGWYYYLTKFLYCLVNGHLLVELEEETTQYNQHKEDTQKEEPAEKTPYEILGVSPTDTIERIKAAYRDLMMKYHPDRMGGLGSEIVDFATKKTQEINAAYDFILNAKGMNRG